MHDNLLHRSTYTKCSVRNQLLSGREVFLCLNAFLMASSFLSMKSKKWKMTWVQPLFGGSQVDAGSLCFLLKRINCQTDLRKNNIRDATVATPQTRNNPQKLLKWSWSGSEFMPLWTMQLVLQNHFLWILCSSPFSESLSIAVDISIARGESLGNA